MKPLFFSKIGVSLFSLLPQINTRLKYVYII